MIAVVKSNATREQKDNLINWLKSQNLEVHISEVSEREAFRQISFVREYAFKSITGHGTDGYLEAIDALLGELR